MPTSLSSPSFRPPISKVFFFLASLIFFLSLAPRIEAFVPRKFGRSGLYRNPSSSLSSSALHATVLDSSTILASPVHSLWLATIDSDIDSIPNDQFGLVFAGGIVVMLGGVLSAVIVGFLLEKGNLYANVAAESYVQSADDEEFWKGLSDEEKKKTEELLDKLRVSKNNENNVQDERKTSRSIGADVKAPSTNMDAITSSSRSSSGPGQARSTDMFNDYGD